jgi:hypothetical protein
MPLEEKLPTRARRKTDHGRSTPEERPVADDRPIVASPAFDVSRGDIERRAYERYCERGCEDGHDLDDWLQAERELLARRSLADGGRGRAL